MYRAIVADDNLANLELLRVLMEKMLFKVFPATSGGQILELLNFAKPDIIITDLVMPDVTIDGYEATRRIRENPRFQHIPIVAITATGELKLREDYASVKFDGVFRKPFLSQELRNHIMMLVEKQIA